MSTNTCVSCGAEIPEGGHVCPACAYKPKPAAEYIFDYAAAITMFSAGMGAGAIITALMYLILI